jgi:hypothetical protein
MAIASHLLSQHFTTFACWVLKGCTVFADWFWVPALHGYQWFIDKEF